MNDLPPDPGRNLALELVRATEAAAIAAARFMGRGDKEKVDQAAVDAMRPVLRSVAMDGVVVIGEGEKDEAPMLYNGEHVGSGVPPAVDVAVDPVDGTTLTAKALPDALAVLALSERGTMFDPGPCVYMEKLAVAHDLADVVDFEASVGRQHRPDRARAAARTPADVTVAILDRPRHRDLVAEVLETGRADQVHARRRRRRRDHGGRRRLVGRPARRRRRHAGGRDRRVRAEVPRRRAVRAAVPARRRRAHGRARRRLRPRSRA